MILLDNISDDIDSVSVSKSMICTPETLVNHINQAGNSLTVFHTNIRSVTCNFDALAILLERICIQCDVLVLTECWLSKLSVIPEISGYTSHSSEYSNQNDGVLLYIKSEIKHSISQPLLSDSSGLIVNFDNEYAILGMYRSPSQRNINKFCDSLDLCLASLASVRSVVLIGDININISPNNNELNNSKYLDLMAHHGFLAAHVLPTRNESCIDHVMLRSNRYTATYILDSFITDHAPIVFHLDCKIIRYPSKTTTLKIDYPPLLKQLSDTDFSFLYNIMDANDAATALTNIITDAIISHSIKINIPHRKRCIKPWLTPGLVRCIRHRDKLHKKAKRDKNNAILQITYTRYRNFCNNLLKKIKTAYEKTEFCKNKRNPKGTWNTINKITNFKQYSPPPCELLNLTQDPHKSLNIVNNYFAEIGSTYANAILKKQQNNGYPNIAKHRSESDPLNNSMVLLDTDCYEIEAIITNLRNDSATGIDRIPSQLIKRAKNSLIPPITYMCNLCLKTGVFPDILKRALVHPIHKSGDRDSVENYRPISVLSALSKILEKVLNFRLTNFLKHNNIISDNQFGFVKGKSTEDATLILTETIAKHLDNKSKVIGVFLDLSKAFDTVSVPLLLHKMEMIGVRGIALDIFRSYLSNRTQLVKIGDYTSLPATVSFGVPQGSVLGPTLFLVYVNSLCKITLPNCKIISYADDTALIVHGKEWKDAQFHTEFALGKVMWWLSSNLLTLNVKKTRYITFTHRVSTQPSAEFHLKAHTCEQQSKCNCPILSRSTHIRYLGLIIDYCLSWSAHISNLTCRIRKLIPILRKLRNSADFETLLCVYYALAQSLLQYCILTWGGIGKTTLLPLERAQRAILKVMLGKSLRYSTELIYKECSVLTVRQLFVMSVILRKHKNTDFIPNLKRNKNRICKMTFHRTALARRQYYVISSHLYNVANKISYIYPMSLYKCKDKILYWLLNLNYMETERLMNF
ncbi:unnamed protein product [Parnassius mnemosyne]|uniref:Reverse transcriptase domain-containing protein n=1 Tax=Parnassius mnemosyne TaxID=213953 RepID=A0AAV1M509_9NEOP